MIKSQYEIQTIKNKLLKEIQCQRRFPYFYSVLEFGFWNDDGTKRSVDTIRKFWDKGEVVKTNRLIKNLLRETFGLKDCWFFLERHSGEKDKYGDVIREGRYHVNLITSNIEDHSVLYPNRKVKRLMRSGVNPHTNNMLENLDETKIILFNNCCKRAEWLNNYSHSIKTQVLYQYDDLRNAVKYCLKDYKKGGLDFMDIVDFENSNFNQEYK